MHLRHRPAQERAGQRHQRGAERPRHHHALSLNAFDVLLNMTPWFHRGGVHVGGPCPTFYVGACTIISRVFQPKLSLQTIEGMASPSPWAPPSSLEMLCRSQEKNPVDLSRLRGG